MRLRRLLATTLVLLLAASLIAVLLTGCDSKPTAPAYNNPFDPEGPTSGNPFNTTAEIFGNIIKLEWDQHQNYGIVTYLVHARTAEQSAYEQIASVDHTSAETGKYNYMQPDPTQTHYFRLFIVATDQTIHLVADQISAQVTTPPHVIIGSGSALVSTRFPTIEVTVSTTGQLYIDDNEAFASPMIVPVEDPGQPQVILGYDLGEAANGDTMHVYIKNVDGPLESVVADRFLTVRFQPSFAPEGRPSSVATRNLDLIIPTEGVLQMRFAESQTALAGTPWLPSAETIAYQLTDTANPQTIYGEFEGDFGFNAITEWVARPDDLEDATFTLDVPADRVVDDRLIDGLGSAVATQMRVSESPNFIEVPWVAYADTLQITLSPEEGRKVLYTQFRNDWTESAILTNYVDYVSQPLTVQFLAPSNGDLLRGGTTLQLMGTAISASDGQPIDGVAVDTGSGFLPATGTDNWTYLWSIPTFEADTALNLRAQAWVGEDTVTTLVNVTVSQMLVEIVSPLDDAVVEGGTSLTIHGTTTPSLDGDPVDLVTVFIDNTAFAATGTSDWSLAWLAPTVTEDTPINIIVVAENSQERAYGVVSIVASQLQVAIEAPVDGANLPGGTDVQITGTATPLLNGDAVESVVVTIDGTDYTADGTTAWSLTWPAPTVAEDSAIDILVTATAGSDTATDQISCTVLGPDE